VKSFFRYPAGRIRSNDQFRLVFNFDRGEASNVVITDYH
jgi:plasmid maintenance system killer protein